MDQRQIQSFQTQHDNHLGAPLDIDGVLGPETRWAYGVDGLTIERRTVIYRCQRAMRREIVETNSDNRHPFIDAVNEAVGAAEGSAWCAATACWALGYTRRTPLAQVLGKSFTATQAPLPGDLMWYPTGDWQGHCGIVGAVGRERVMIYEGNSSNQFRAVLRPWVGLRFAQTIKQDWRPWVDPRPITPPSRGLVVVTSAGLQAGTR